ncbi:mammalian cell entry protein [Mycobacterium sp. NS-7484]|uniref:virulence factor Mce family protein n=1 Tax=unclassified Mycobacterium TaxID=2642494 RepID=UPI0007FD3A21|nr:MULTISPECIES: virulence factor Mce family protein [unclassified Mycobacterium]OBG86835.1 mammalian cell entry protein [Mycobacterium sp. E802]OMC02850.1 mammalian cell entry protein [Mycobacterium sp. NS-7484]
MRTLQGSDRFRKGLMGVVVVALIIAVGSTLTSVPMLFAVPTYYGQFSDTGGLNTGDKVRIAGMDVGTVRSMEINGDKVEIGFTLGGKTIGTESRAAIRTDTILGRKNIEIQPRGSHTLAPGGMLPLGQTTTPYQIYDAFLDVTRNAAGWDTKSVKESLNVLSETVDQTSPHLSAALDGVAKFSETIGKRDEDVKKLLANANKVATVLGDRSTQVNQLLVNAQTLLAAVNERGQAVSMLLERVSSVSHQVEGVINDNPNLNHVLEQLRTVSDLLVERKQDLADTLTVAGKFITSLAEALASGPYFKVMLVNLIPPQILQPFVDAAFKKRGIDPEEFWRNAGLPSFRFPDPNGQRHENGAPAAAPTPLEGTPEHPGPAVPPGSPCSYTPTAAGIPSPGNPLPCAGATQGPFGPVPGGFGPPDVATSAPNPDGVAHSPGVPSAAIPGQMPPDQPGAPVELAPGPPGARTVPIAPQPLPGEIPGYAPHPAPVNAPPAPPGPGPDAGPAGTPPLPGNPPFLPPGSQG